MYVYYDIVILTEKSLYFLHNGYMSSCEKILNGYVNLKRTVGYQSTKIGKFACYILACLSSCLITEWLQLPHGGTSSCPRVSVYCTVSCFAGSSVFTSMVHPHSKNKLSLTSQEKKEYPVTKALDTLCEILPSVSLNRVFIIVHD